MPNWCSNKWHVHFEDEDERAEFVETCLSRNPDDHLYIDFNKVRPLPAVFETETDEDVLTAETGSPDPRSWRESNWGVKGSLGNGAWCRCKVRHGDFHFKFATAWCPPGGIFDALHEQFESIEVSALYYEPGMGLAGYLEH